MTNKSSLFGQAVSISPEEQGVFAQGNEEGVANAKRLAFANPKEFRPTKDGQRTASPEEITALRQELGLNG